MFNRIKAVVKLLIPKSLFKKLQPAYHGLVAKIAARYFDNPSHKLYVIGITGTAGKSTTVMMLAHILNHAGRKTGYITTAGSSDGNDASVNKHGLSMPGGWLLQNQLAQMVNNDCQYAIVECTSEGLAQNRHQSIMFQAGLFTNLSPAHLDAHGSFENYRSAKGKLFEAVSANTNGTTIIGVNADDPSRDYFVGFKAGRKFGVSTRADMDQTYDYSVTLAKDIVVSDKLKFAIDGTEFVLHLFGSFNITNALLAIEFAHQIGIPLEESAAALAQFNKVPGRMETIPNDRGLNIIVDYAPEPAAMKASLEAAAALPHSRLIHVFGSTGGHRDVAKRFEFGEISAKVSDVIIVTNDDVYDSDPVQIAENVKEGISKVNKPNLEVKTILDRKDAIELALEIAKPGDIILVTGKGSEQFLVLPGNERIPWDDREIIKESLK